MYRWEGKKMYTLLIADDEPLIRNGVKKIIDWESLGFSEIFLAEDGQEALDIFEQSREQEIDLILMDIMMPVMDGLEATRRIRTCTHPRGATVPIIAISANAFADDIQKAKNPGMNEHLAKPFEMEKVLSAMPEGNPFGMKATRILEINPNHPIFAALQKVYEHDASACRAEDVLKMACVGGARAMGLPDCDDIAVGKRADLVVINLRRPNMQPLNNIASNIVYAGSKENVRLTMVNGRILYSSPRI